jgi:hypothetical protein
MSDTVTVLGLAIIIVLSLFAMMTYLWIASRKERDTARADAESARERMEHLQSAYGPVELVDQRLQMATLQAQRAEHDHAVAAGRQREELDALAQQRDEIARQLAMLQELDDAVSVGLYRPRYDFATSDLFTGQLESVREEMKRAVKEGRAVLSHVAWTVDGSKKAGEKMTKEFIKLVLRAFNGECDACVAKVKWDSIVQMEKRIVAAFEAINKIAASNRCEIAKPFMELRLAELRLVHEMQVKKQAEREEQRAIREQMREEERTQREIERAKDDAEKEELRRARALEQARKEADRAVGEAKAAFDEKVRELEAKLAEAQSKVRAVSMAELTTTGHVYVLSNIGSFGEGVYKIGMTRRLEPQDRVDELGDASVPFPFDVHAMIRTVNAPALERALHERFANKRVNLVNLRKEFFRLTLEEIEAVVREMSERTDSGIRSAVEWRRTGLAEEYWESKGAVMS